MVKLRTVSYTTKIPHGKRIGVFASLVQGFEHIAAQPLLILPPIFLDLLLWFGPQLRIQDILRQLLGFLDPMLQSGGAGTEIVEQIELFRTLLMEFGKRFNLLTSLSSLPIGIPSLMKNRLPVRNPLGHLIPFEILHPTSIIGLWMLFTIVGIGLGAFYHRLIARQGNESEGRGSLLAIWLRLLSVSILIYVLLGSLVPLIMVAVSIIGLLSSFLSNLFILLGFSVLFWIILFLVFAPHGIVRNGLGILQAFLESVQLVRWHLSSTVGFVTVALALSWLTSQIWFLPEDGSWFLILAVIGHAFVVSMIFSASYVFYQDRREWLVRFRLAVANSLIKNEPPIEAN